MVDELSHRGKTFPARRTARYNYAFAALSDITSFVNEVREIVTMNLLLNGCEQCGFLQGGSDWTSVPGENAFVGEFPGTKQIEEYLRKRWASRGVVLCARFAGVLLHLATLPGTTHHGFHGNP
jgi:hypothetical protein